MALSKRYRLSKTKDIERVIQCGRKYATPFFRLFFYFNNLPYSRYAFSISKKVSKKATERNRLRRRMSSWTEKHGKQEVGVDVVLFAGPKAQTLSRKNIYEELEHTFHRLSADLSKNSFSRS